MYEGAKQAAPLPFHGEDSVQAHTVGVPTSQVNTAIFGRKLIHHPRHELWVDRRCEPGSPHSKVIKPLARPVL